MVAERLHGAPADELRTLARAAFDEAFVAVIGVATAILFATAVIIRLNTGRAHAWREMTHDK